MTGTFVDAWDIWKSKSSIWLKFPGEACLETRQVLLKQSQISTEYPFESNSDMNAIAFNLENVHVGNWAEPRIKINHLADSF